MNARNNTIFAEPNAQARAEEMMQEEIAALEEHAKAIAECGDDYSFASEARIAGAWDRYVRLIHRDRPRSGDAQVLDYHAAKCSHDANGLRII